MLVGWGLLQKHGPLNHCGRIDPTQLQDLAPRDERPQTRFDPQPPFKPPTAISTEFEETHEA